MIDQATIDRILDAAQIVDVVSEFVTLRRAGVNYKGLCPFHDEKTPSFVVSPAKGLCKCFSCGKGGNAVHFVMEHEQLNYYEALKWLAGKYHIEVREHKLTDEEKQARSDRESMFVVNEFARDYFQNILHNHVDGQSVGLAYFRQRGFRDDIIRKFQLGYSLAQYDALAKEASRKGFKEDFLLKTGVCYKRDSDGQLRDRFWGRVIFPVHTLSGKVVAFGGRILKTDAKAAKYVNSPESEIYHKSNQLYGIYFAKQAIVKEDRCFLVEGYTDVISMHQSGVENVVSSSGTSLTPGQIRLIHRFTNNITVLYDGDGAGIRASIRGIDMLLEEGMHIKVVLLPDGDDPDSFARKHNAADFRNYITSHEVDFIRFKTGLLLQDAGSDPIKRAGLIADIVHSISVIPENIVRSVYIRECCQLLQVEERLLIEEVNKLKRQQAEKRQTPNIQRQVSTIPGTAVSSLVPNVEAAKPAVSQSSVAAVNVPVSDDDTGIAAPPLKENVAQEPEYITYIPHAGQQNKVFYAKEILIMQILIRYGERVMYMLTTDAGEEVAVTVVEHIVNDLKEDNLQFYDLLHRQILSEASKHVRDTGFVANRYFFSHPNPAISKVAAELASERYQLSKYHSRTQKIVSEDERLHELVPHLLTDFKLAIIEEELKHILVALQDSSTMSDIARYTEIMRRYKDLSEIQRVIAKRAGDRVILS